MHRSIALSALVLLTSLLVPRALRAQARVAVAEENFRATPGGAIVATLEKGTPLLIGGVRDRWREATLDGWVWAPSTRAETSGGHALRLTAKGGENLRSGPGGERIGHLVEGARLDRVDGNGRWLHVRRSGWIWNASIESLGPVTPAPGPARDSARPPAAADTTRAAPTEAVAPTAAGVPAGAESHGGEYAGFTGAALSAAPDGDTTALLRPLARVQVLERDGDWVRARIEGWVRAADLTAAPDSGGVLGDSDIAALQAQGDALRGRPVRWSLSFLSLGRAEALRTDFQPGEHFILARGPDDLDRLVYVAVPDSLLARVRSLAPLQRFTAFGRIRTPRSRQTGAPVIELLGLH